ncbi:hypothetical protein ACFDR9_004655, partial [Janthinobacterium sp. CG_23.3]
QLLLDNSNATAKTSTSGVKSLARVGCMIFS